MVWRDRWDTVPNLVIVAEEDEQQGVIEDALLFFGIEDPAEDPVVMDKQGRRYRVTLPEDLKDPMATMLNGVDLDVELI